MRATGAVRGLVSSLVVMASAVSGTPATGQGGTACEVDVDLFVTPGLSISPSSGTVTSNGEKGSMECKGHANGNEIIGTGGFGADGQYGTKDADTCLTGGEGEARVTMILPTAQGDERIETAMSFVYGALDGGGPLSGTFTSEQFSGTFELTPEKGDCVATPVTRVRGLLRGALK